MADPKTVLVVPGKKLSVSRLIKQAVQTAAGLAFGALAIGVVMITSGLLSGRGTFAAAVNNWLAFVQRGDILASMALTAAATVLFISWQRDKERGR